MATTAPEAPSLNFKAKSGFITKRAIFRDEVEEEAPVEEEVVEEEPIEEEPIEEEPVEEEWIEEEPLEGEEFWEEEPTVEEEWVEEETPIEEEAPTVEQAPPPAVEQPTVEQPRVERREPTVIVQPADAGGRTGSALPTPAEMAAYANPDDRGRAILRQFEEEDQRLAEQRTTEVESRPNDEDSIFHFNVQPPSGGLKWVILIAVLTVLGYTVVRQLAMDPLKPRMTEKQRQKLMAEVQSTTAQATKASKAAADSRAATVQSKAAKLKASTESDELKKLMEERPAMARALKEVQAAYSEEAPKSKPKPPRVEQKTEVSKDGRKHIEIRI